LPSGTGRTATDLWASELGRTLQRIDRDLGRQQRQKLLPAAKSAHGFDGFDRPIYILHKTVNHGTEMFAK